MEEGLARLEQELRNLAQSVRDIEARLSALETRAASAKVEKAAPEIISTPTEEISASVARGWADTSGLLSYAGRLFIVMSGAYFLRVLTDLLRALTEASTISAAVGITLGLVYSLVWAVAAGRAAVKGSLWNGAFHGAAAALIAYPLIWESATRFKILPPLLDAWLIAGLTAAFFTVACKYRFQPLAWFANVGSVATVMTLLVTTESYVPRTVFLIALGIATLWMGYELEWRGLRWLAALAADLAILDSYLQNAEEDKYNIC